MHHLFFFITVLTESYGWMFIGLFITMLLPWVARNILHDLVDRVEKSKTQTQIAREREVKKKERERVSVENEKIVLPHIDEIRKSKKFDAFKSFFTAILI